MTEFFKRLLHARGRKKQAARNFYVKKTQTLMRIDSRPTTEINYLLKNRFQTQVISRSTLASASETCFVTKDGMFRHNFNVAEIVTLNSAIVDTEFNHVYAITNRGAPVLLQESSDWPSSTITQFHRIGSSISKVTLANVSLGLGSRGFYHMVVEDLSRIISLDKSNRILQYAQSSGKSFEILAAMSFEVISVPKFVRVENFTFVTHGNDLGYLNSWQLNALRENFKDLKMAPSGEKLYISRSFTRRSPSFEAGLMEKLRNSGFRIVHLEEMKFEDQVRLLSSAEVIVGVHGAGLTGSLWAHQPLVIELMEENYFNRCFEWQTLMNNGKYERIFYTAKSTDADVIFDQIFTKLNAI
jgi:hypothetical protein